jgi:hypothetical protein
MDLNKIVSALLVLAISGLFTSVFVLNDTTATLSKQIAVSEERNINESKSFTVLTNIVDNLTKVVDQNSDRITRIEWEIQKKIK